MEYETLERDIEKLESDKREMTASLSQGNLNGAEVLELGEHLAKVVELIELKTNRWLELSEYQ